jgi:hypothetical protein
MSDALAARQERTFDLERNATSHPRDWAGTWPRPQTGGVIPYVPEGAM